MMRRRPFSLILFSAWILLWSGQTALFPGVLPISTPVAWAATAPAKKKSKDPFEKETAKIPKTPSPPPDISTQAPSDIFRCERIYKKDGMTGPCDSTAAMDGERLRPIFQDTPEAIKELELYQRNRRRLRTAAYVGTASILALIATSIAQQRYADAAKNASPGDTGSKESYESKANLFGALYYVSAGFAVGTVIFGISMLQTNEAHLGQAVQHYNNAHPKQPVELQFSTEIPF